MARSSSPNLDNLKKAIAIAEQIQQLEGDLARILAGSGLPAEPIKRRGRPPKVTGAGEEKLKPRKKRVMSEAGRRRITEAQKRRWAAKRKAS
jgi:hypothetical protein